MMAAEEEIELEAPASLMNLEDVHNSGGGNEAELSTPNDDDDDDSMAMYQSSSSSWTKKKKYATAALALASVVILAVAIGTPTGITAKNNNANNNNVVTSAMMNLDNCIAIMKKLELDEPSPAPSTYEPTTYTPTTDPPVFLSNDVADLVEALDGEPVRGRDLRGGWSTEYKEARVRRVHCDKIFYVCLFVCDV